MRRIILIISSHIKQSSRIAYCDNDLRLILNDQFKDDTGLIALNKKVIIL